MNKPTPYILLALLGLALLAFYLKRTQADLERDAGAQESSAGTGSRTEGSSNSDPLHAESSRKSEERSPPNPRPAPPFLVDPKNLYSASVTAEIKKGETLVMGGYRKPDGRHEFTLLTPTLITNKDGEEQIVLKSKVIAVAPKFAEESGMDSLTTQSRTADGRAEAWSQSTLQSTMRSASQSAGTQLMSSPIMTANPGELLNFNVGQEGGPNYGIEATIKLNKTGGFSMQVLTERAPDPEH